MLLRRRLLDLIRDAPWRVGAVVTLGLAAMGCCVAQGVLAARAVAAILAGGSWRSIVPLLLWTAALIAVRAAILWLREVTSMATAGAIKERLRGRLYSHLLELGPGYLERTRTGFVQSTLVDGVEALEGYVGFYVPQAVVAVVGPTLLLAWLFTLDPVVGALVAVCVLVVPLAPRFWDRLLGERGAAEWQAQRELSAQFLDGLQGMTTLKTFNAARRRGESLHRQAVALYRATMAQLSVAMIRNGIVGLASGAGTALAVGVGALRAARGEIAISDLLLLLFLTGECFRPLVELDRYWHQGYSGLTAAGQIFELLDARPKVADPAGAAPLAVARRPTLAFEEVTFAYGPGRRALAGVSFRVEAGETVAVVGRSGAGKTTLLSLLLRFFDPQEGRILLDGLDLREIRLEELRRAIAVVSQDTYLFHGTLADNLRLARPEASREELEAVARAANIHDLIESLPLGYDTPVGERGLRLSGGERQRIAIARALLKDAPILLLDEATSSVDGANEAAIQEALDRLTADRTTLVVAHRLSTVQGADRIVVLDEGGAAEIGSHAELLRRRGAYARLVEAQRRTA